MTTITIDDINGLPDLADKLTPYLDEYNVIAFFGPMGAGKTTLIRELCHRLGVRDTVASPTFALVNQYESPGRGPVFHFDFYRIDKIDEVYDLGYEEYFYGGHLCLIEWPEKVESLLPENTLGIRITTDPASPGKRTFEILPVHGIDDKVTSLHNVSEA